MLSRRPELFWLLIVLVVLLLAVWWIPGASSVNTDSYSVAYGGKKVLYQAMRQLDPSVSRSVDQLVPGDVYTQDTILILGPARYPSDEEWRSIHEAVLSGHSVVFAAKHTDPHVNAGPFHVKVAAGTTSFDSFESGDPLDQEESAPTDGKTKAPVEIEPDDDKVDNSELPAEMSFDEAEDEAAVDNKGTDSDATEDGDYPKSLSELLAMDKASSKLVEGEVPWRSSARIEMEDDEWEVLVEVDSVPQAVQRNFGRGTFTLIASDDNFSNGAMTLPDRALLAWRLLESASTDGSTMFDETLNSSGVPKVFGILFDPLFRPITLQLILIIVLFGWLGSRRFGPACRSLHTRRRSVVEHAEAVGTLYFRAGAGPHAVKCLHEFLKQELRNRYGQTFQVDNSERVARLAHADKKEVQNLFNEIKAFSYAKRSSATAARLLQRLSQLLVGIRRQARDDSN